MSSLKFLSAAALFGASAVVGQTILRAEDVLSRSYASISSDIFLIRRQDQLDDSESELAPMLNPDGSFNSTAWTAATDAACRSKLRTLQRSPNPSGSSVCFNLPSLDANSGAFEADLRVYSVFPPSGDWSGVDPRDVDVGVGFPSASVRNITEEEVQAIGLQGDVGGLSKRQSEFREPVLMQAHLLVGKINEDKFKKNMSMSELEALLLPILTLTAGDLRTTVSPNSASFITGVFSSSTPQSDYSLAQRAVDQELERLKNGDVAFVLPGTQILIFPIGAIITGTWALLGIGVYGYGTYERWRFRELYRSRKRALDNMGRGRGGPGI